jgi:ribosomal protein S18 acetylase RimI-like enzyme
MAQCAGRNQRTGEQCKRSAAAGASTCYYHGPEAAQAKEARRRLESQGQALTSGRRAFTTKVLSKRTFDDFDTLFAVGTGWGRCGCLFALDARRSTRGGTWAEQRELNLRTMRGLVEQGRSQGILVYDDGAPVGWCQFVPKAQLRFTAAAAPGADWFITCFVVDPRYRGLGATGVALRAAVKAISRRGGGVVEGHATAMAPGPPPKPDRKDLYEDGDVLFWGGSARVRFGVEVDGVGPVAALYRSRRSMHSAPLGGTVDLYRREGFEAVGVLPRPKSRLADRIIMRRTV